MRQQFGSTIFATSLRGRAGPFPPPIRHFAETCSSLCRRPRPPIARVSSRAADAGLSTSTTGLLLRAAIACQIHPAPRSPSRHSRQRRAARAHDREGRRSTQSDGALSAPSCLHARARFPPNAPPGQRGGGPRASPSAPKQSATSATKAPTPLAAVAEPREKTRPHPSRRPSPRGARARSVFESKTRTMGFRSFTTIEHVKSLGAPRSGVKCSDVLRFAVTCCEAM